MAPETGKESASPASGDGAGPWAETVTAAAEIATTA